MMVAGPKAIGAAPKGCASTHTHTGFCFHFYPSSVALSPLELLVLFGLHLHWVFCNFEFTTWIERLPALKSLCIAL